jgi:hypothetical protein
VKAMLLLMQGQVVNESFVLVGKNISYRELLSEIALNLNKKAPNKKVSKWVVRAISNIDWALSFLLGRDQKLPKSTVNTLYKTSFYNSSKITNELNFNFISHKETLLRVAKNYMSRT